jgi:nucleotide-binding universal stress UspA family protein
MKILVATDGSAQAAAAILLLRRVAGLEKHEFVLLSISDAREVALISAPIAGALDQVLKSLDQEAQEALKSHSRLFEGAETLELLHRRGDAADVILQQAEEMGADLIVMGSAGLGPLTGPLLGSVSHRVAAHCQCSVLLGRSQDTQFEKHLKVIVGIDGSPRSRAATDFVGQFSLLPTDQVECIQVLTLVTAFRMDLVQKMSAIWVQEKKVANQNIKAAKSRLEGRSDARISARLEEGESAGGVLVELARQQEADLLAVGHRGLGPVRRFLLGSVSSYILHHAPCGVLIVKTAVG